MTVLIPITALNQTSTYHNHRAREAGTDLEWTVYFNPRHVDYRPTGGSPEEREARARRFAEACSERNARVYTKHTESSPEYGVRIRYDGSVPSFGSEQLTAEVD